MPKYVTFREKSGQSGSVDAGFSRRYSKEFVVEVDTPDASVWFVGSHPSLPKIFNQHPDDLLAYCVNITPTQRADNPFVWDVKAEFSYSLDTRSGLVATGNPLIDEQMQGKPPAERQQATTPMLRGNDYSYSVIQYGVQRVDEDTQTGNTIANTLGDPFTTNPERKTYALKIVVGMNMIGAPNHEWEIRVGKLNLDAITIGTRMFSAKTVMFESITSDLVYEESVSYWRWKLEFLSLVPPDGKTSRADAWKWSVVNRGSRGKHITIDKNNVKGPVTVVPWGVASKTGEGGHHDLDKDGFFRELQDPKTAQHKLSFNIHNTADFPGAI